MNLYVKIKRYLYYINAENMNDVVNQYSLGRPPKLNKKT